jgi:hypothetical protein
MGAGLQRELGAHPSPPALGDRSASGSGGSSSGSVLNVNVTSIGDVVIPAQSIS